MLLSRLEGLQTPTAKQWTLRSDRCIVTRLEAEGTMRSLVLQLTLVQEKVILASLSLPLAQIRMASNKQNVEHLSFSTCREVLGVDIRRGEARKCRSAPHSYSSLSSILYTRATNAIYADVNLVVDR